MKTGKWFQYIPALVFTGMIFNASGQIIHIPDDYPTIQQGIDAANLDDTVLVAPGTYYENLELVDKRIILASHFLTTDDTSFISSTIIDGSHSGTVLIIHNNMGANTRVCGFTITNGLGSGGGGIMISSVYPNPGDRVIATLDHLIISNNEADIGGGIYIYWCDPVLEDCQVFGNSAIGRGGGIYTENSFVTMNALSITSNSSGYRGGGIYIDDNSPVLSNLTIAGNSTGDMGGGIYCSSGYSMPALVNCNIKENNATSGAGIGNDGNLSVDQCNVTGNIATWEGGGIYTYYSIIIINSVIDSNSAEYGGGMWINGDVSIDTTEITRNQANAYGGGLYLTNSSGSNLNKVLVSENHAESYGGGFYAENHADLNLKASTISYNRSEIVGGGIYQLNDQQISFDNIDRCNIFLNRAPFGNDLYLYGDTLDVIVDTFTVMNPTDHHARYLEDFTFDILSAKIQQVNADLYISPEGDDDNSGLTPEEPLKTINRAYAKLIADKEHQHTVYLADGTYSRSATGEVFPVCVVNQTSLCGESRWTTILDAQNMASVMNIYDDTIPMVSSLKITGGKGSWYSGGGINCYNSEVGMNNLWITGNVAEREGGGLSLGSSDVILSEMLFENDSAQYGGAIHISHSGTTMLNNVSILNNFASEQGGGIYSYVDEDMTIMNTRFEGNHSKAGGGGYLEHTIPLIINTLFANNSVFNYGGGLEICNESHNSILTNCTFADNEKTGLLCKSVGAKVTNCIFRGNTEAQILAVSIGPKEDTLFIDHSDVSGGSDSIIVNGSAELVWLEGNIAEDPHFILDGDYPYALADDSPCIDAGTPDITGLFLPLNDLAGCVRVWDGDNDGTAVIDMGAYEYGAPVGIDEEVPGNENDLAAVRIYPNPASDRVTIAFSDFDNPRRVIFINSAGQVVRTVIIPAGQAEAFIPLDSFPPGIYFVITRGETGTDKADKFIILPS